jgi:ATP-binding cassette subfamily B protein
MSDRSALPDAPTDGLGPGMSVPALIRRTLEELRPYRGRALLLGAMLVIEIAFQAALPLSFKILVDRAVVARDPGVLVTVLSALGLGIVLVTAGGLVRDRVYAELSSRVLGNLRQRLFDHLQRLSMDFHSRSRAGDLLSRFSSDLAGIEGVMTNAIPWGVLPAFDVMVSTVLLFWLDWRLALLAMLIWPLSLAGPRVFAPRASRASYQRKLREADLLSRVQENLGSQPVVKAFSLGPLVRSGFQGVNAALVDGSIRFGFVSALVERSAAIGIQVLQVLVLGAGAWMALEGILSVGSLAAFQTLFLSLSYSLSYVTQFLPSLLQAAGGMTRVDELLAEKPRVADAPGAATFQGRPDRIAFEDVDFAYGDGAKSLDRVRFEIRAGQTVAFVGSSGSGKSTVLSLMLRFHDPQAGAVRFDGEDLREVTQESLRSRLGVVFQDNFLFNTSLRENIRIGRPDAADPEVESAARAAEIHDFISGLPQGYETSAGERGGRLSGGQRQRIGIARALLRNPAVLLLDEATSALDPRTEAALNQTLARAGQGRTVVSVTHRLQSAVGADRIFVLDRGRLVEQGSHDELLRGKGAYQRLWEKQSGFALNDEGDAALVTADRLRAFPILEKLDPALLAGLTRSFVTERFAPGRVVILEGDPGNKFYVVVRGSLEVITGDLARPTPVSVLQDGDYFGEIALLRDVPRTASVRALTESLLLSLPREAFQALLTEAPHLRGMFRPTQPIPRPTEG